MVSPSYSSAILAPPPPICKFLDDAFLYPKGKNLDVNFPLETLLL